MTPRPTTLRALPAVDQLARRADAMALQARFARPQVVEALRAALDAARRRLRDGGDAAVPDGAALVADAAARLAALATPSLRPVINATRRRPRQPGRAPLRRRCAWRRWSRWRALRAESTCRRRPRRARRARRGPPVRASPAPRRRWW
ncbi:MAG: hypothetical protein U0802_17530 [Candidatus Binatia bacterium]